MDVKPTKKQVTLLDFIDTFMRENGYSPSYREIQSALGLKTVSSVAEHIENCVRGGFLIKTDNKARSLEVVPQKTYEETRELFTAKLVELELDAENNKSAISTLQKAQKILGL